MSEENEGDKGKPNESKPDEIGPLAGWLLNNKQKSFLRSLLPEDEDDGPDADPPQDKTLSTSAALEAILLFPLCYFVETVVNIM